MRRTVLRECQELKALMRLVAKMEVAGMGMAGVMVRVGYSYEKAAVMMGVKSGTLRQRVVRMEEVAREVFGRRWRVEVKRRVRVKYGADGRAYKWAGKREEEG